MFIAPVEFTDEEGYGKYLDLHECYEKFINLKGIEVTTYYIFLYPLQKAKQKLNGLIS